MTAESIVPSTWWRKGFAHDALLLSHNDTELPRKMLETSSRLRGKKLKNIVQCVTRQQFIRKSFDFSDATAVSQGRYAEKTGGRLNCMSESTVSTFFGLWSKRDKQSPGLWSDEKTDDMVVSAVAVLDYFFANAGGIWTGCFKLEKNAECRGALAGNYRI